MKHNTLMFGIAFACALLTVHGNTAAQEKPDEEAQAELMKMYMELANPGEEHKLLESLVGTWDTEVKLWGQPGQDPMTATGTAVNTMILGGRFLLTESTGGEGPMKLESLSITGFDKRHKKYTMVGFDTWGTYYVTAAGSYDDTTRTITMYGEDEDPVMGVTQKYDFIVRILSEDTYVEEIVFKDFRTPNEEEFKAVEITYTRK